MRENTYDFISIPQLAKLLGISRIAVYKKVKQGKIKTIRVGKTYAIAKKYVDELLGTVLKDTDKKNIDNAINKTILDFGDVLKLLGNE
ncbi:MAG: helix-turn-helix domain-containing protein [Elusimicrobia bacterium]|nr:helix-turn-helix domain-containing protein [Elusimicrobiota bacterium]MBD3412007.1 helix-turn-helix domain-containing protein [Elusimicrobiota bacterium]